MIGRGDCCGDGNALLALGHMSGEAHACTPAFNESTGKLMKVINESINESILCGESESDECVSCQRVKQRQQRH